MSLQIPQSELILNSDGSVYHLALHAHEIADWIILVGDPERVPQVSAHFDSIQLQRQKREFRTHTGMLNDQPISVVSTGIGTDNIDIVLNELNLLRNADLKTRTWNKEARSLNLIRLGTSGTVSDQQLDSLLLSSSAIGIDGLAWHYGLDSRYRAKEFEEATGWSEIMARPYEVAASSVLLEAFQSLGTIGRTLTATGFYQPQGRQLNSDQKVLFDASVLEQAGIDNLEMETAGIYCLAQHFGFEALSINLILASRKNHQFSVTPEASMHAAIEQFIHRLTEVMGQKG